jgi:hypothetical protein
MPAASPAGAQGAARPLNPLFTATSVKQVADSCAALIQAK